MNLSPELAALVGQRSMARHEVVEKVRSIIKERDLYNPKNNYVICDDALFQVIGVKRFCTFEMKRYLESHFRGEDRNGIKKVWSIIEERDLYDPKNKQYAICDDALFKVIGVKPFHTFGIMKYLKDHFIS
ncbi:hypothetical protein ILUMI_15436 [Ignelater luminosus]|uniref:DM2 domain-containing protein n=1 Tax=Ignelater luminosus TaxID=2038154 RepID=A0A8K0CUQ0_IGNLU|nr:hypothetical protein ILUMI_15436 [Ignelater luminosus]